VALEVSANYVEMAEKVYICIDTYVYRCIWILIFVAQSGAGGISELRGNGGKGVYMYRYICI